MTRISHDYVKLNNFCEANQMDFFRILHFVDEMNKQEEEIIKGIEDMKEQEETKKLFDEEILELREEIFKLKSYIKELSSGLAEACADIRDLRRQQR